MQLRTDPNNTYSDFDKSPMYRYSFQGQEKDDEVVGASNSINYTYRMHDVRVGRFFAVDPLAGYYAWNSPYAFSGNQVIHAVELEGLESNVIIQSETAYNQIIEATANGDITEALRLTYEACQNGVAYFEQDVNNSGIDISYNDEILLSHSDQKYYTNANDIYESYQDYLWGNSNQELIEIQNQRIEFIEDFIDVHSAKLKELKSNLSQLEYARAELEKSIDDKRNLVFSEDYSGSADWEGTKWAENGYLLNEAKKYATIRADSTMKMNRLKTQIKYEERLIRDAKMLLEQEIKVRDFILSQQ
ncbi:MAG: hypothetical protein JNJ99_16305 [Crocinitomicaceae bacterium]|nr:hypothetical protein [Crocinitomicaceae bacterium]